jgi:hypothetical protein
MNAKTAKAIRRKFRQESVVVWREAFAECQTLPFKQRLHLAWVLVRGKRRGAK